MIAFSGIPFFYYGGIFFMTVMMMLPLAVVIVRRQKPHRFIAGYIVVVAILLFLQTIKFYHMAISTYAGLMVRLMFAYLVILAVGKKSVKYYIDILCFSVVTSLFFNIISYIPAINNFLTYSIAPIFDHPLLMHEKYTIWPQFILYTINFRGESIGSTLMRNSGPFWEPGAFAGFILIAILMNTIINKKLFGNRVNHILFVGLLSTFSTTGLIAGFFLTGIYYLLWGSGWSKLIIVPAMLLGGITAYISFEFLGRKIDKAMDVTNIGYNTRFKSAMLDINDFVENPLLGMGMTKETRFEGKTQHRIIHRNNGVTNLLATYGIFIFLAYFALIYHSFRRMCSYYDFHKEFAWIALLVIMLAGFSEIFFNKIFFYSLTMIHLLYLPSKKEEQA
jgi:hypothetical protein